MTPREWQVIAERTHEAIAWAREVARRSAETRATAAELTIIAEDLRSRTQAERKRARSLAMERDHADPAVVRLGDGRTPRALNYLPPSETPKSAPDRRGDRSAIANTRSRPGARDSRLAVVLNDMYPVQWTGEQAVVTLPKHIDVSNACLVREELLMLINRGAVTLIADMTATLSCDRAGADAVARAHKRAVVNGTAAARGHCRDRVARIHHRGT